jgi:hypothetical protein
LRQRKKTREAAEPNREKRDGKKNERWIGMETDTKKESFVAP